MAEQTNLSASLKVPKNTIELLFTRKKRQAEGCREFGIVLNSPSVKHNLNAMLRMLTKS